ncbi:MAG: class I SAM-dependent methyltransferase [Cyclobacteriaceae bacterium]
MNKIKTLTQKPIKELDEEYIKWLTFANAGMLNPGNSYAMDFAIRHLPTENPIIEIGSFCGLSTNVMSYLLKNHDKNNKIITSDRWIFEGAERGGALGDSSIEHSDFRLFVIETFKNNVSFFSKGRLPYPVEVFSDEFFKLWSSEKRVTDIFNREIQMGGNKSFAYIDGNHSYEYSKRDFQNVSNNRDVGGFILFDDSSYFSQFGFTKLMKEVKKNADYELVMKNPNYLFRKLK